MFNKSWGYRLGAQFLCIVEIDKEKGTTYIGISMVNTDTKEVAQRNILRYLRCARLLCCTPSRSVPSRSGRRPSRRGQI